MDWSEVPTVVFPLPVEGEPVRSAPKPTRAPREVRYRFVRVRLWAGGPWPILDNLLTIGA